jgi:hypothetical protein
MSLLCRLEHMREREGAWRVIGIVDRHGVPGIFCTCARRFFARAV